MKKIIKTLDSVFRIIGQKTSNSYVDYMLAGMFIGLIDLASVVMLVGFLENIEISDFISASCKIINNFG